MSIRKEISNRIQGIAILMMIVHHLFAFPDRLMFDYISVWGGIETFVGSMCKICVSIFAFLSGYGWYKRKVAGFYVISKSLKLFVLHVLILTVYYIADMQPLNVTDVLQNVFCINNRLNHAAWYIPFYIIALASMLLWQRIDLTWVKWAFVTAIFFGIEAILNATDVTIFSWADSYLQYMPVVLSGYVAGKSKQLGVLQSKFNKNIKSAVMIVVLLLAVLACRVLTGSEIAGFHFIWIYTPPIMFCLNYLCDAISDKNLISLLLDFMSKYSTEFWLLNAIFTTGIIWIQRLCFCRNYLLLL